MATISVPSAPAGVSQITAVKPQAVRLASVDLLRGLVMVVMALDHTRDFFT